MSKTLGEPRDCVDCGSPLRPYRHDEGDIKCGRCEAETIASCKPKSWARLIQECLGRPAKAHDRRNKGDGVEVD